MTVAEFVGSLDEFSNFPPNSEQFRSIGEIPEREDSLSLIEPIFEISETDIILMLGFRIIDYVINNRREEIDESAAESIKEIVVKFLPKFAEKSNQIFNKACDVIAHITILQSSEHWHTLLELCFSSNPPVYRILREFIEYVNDESIEMNHSEGQAFIREIIPELLPRVVEEFPENHTKKLFILLMKYTTFEQMAEIGLEKILSLNDIRNFPVIIKTCTTYPLGIEHIQQALALLLQIEADCEMFCDICDLLSMHFHDLDPQLLHAANEKLIQTDFETNLDYWEYFLITTYNDFKTKNDGSIIEQNKDLFIEIRNNLFLITPNPPDLVFGEDNISIYDQSSLSNYRKTLSMVNIMIELDRSGTAETLGAMFEKVKSDEEDLDLFYSFVYCVSIYDLVDEEFASQCIEYAFAQQEKPGALVPTVACFMYMAMKFLEREVLSEEYVDDIANAAIANLPNHRLCRQATNLLLMIAHKCSNHLFDKIDIDLFFKVNLAKEDIAIDLGYIITIIYAEGRSIEELIESVQQKWGEITKLGVNMDTLLAVKFFLCLIVGISKTEAEETGHLPMSIISELKELTIGCFENIMAIVEEKGTECKLNDKCNLMLSIISLQIKLIIEAEVPEYQHLFEICSQLPAFLIPSEFLELCLSLVGDSDALAVIRPNVLDKIEEYCAEDSTISVNILALCCRIISCLTKQPDFFSENDVTFAISCIKRSDEDLSYASLVAIKKIVKKFGGEASICQYFPTIISEFFIKIIDSYYIYNDSQQINEICALISQIFTVFEDKEALSSGVMDILVAKYSSINREEVQGILNGAAEKETVIKLVYLLYSNIKDIPQKRIEQEIVFNSIKKNYE